MVSLRVAPTLGMVTATCDWGHLFGAAICSNVHLDAKLVGFMAVCRMCHAQSSCVMFYFLLNAVWPFSRACWVQNSLDCCYLFGQSNSMSRQHRVTFLKPITNLNNILKYFESVLTVCLWCLVIQVGGSIATRTPWHPMCCANHVLTGFGKTGPKASQRSENQSSAEPGQAAHSQPIDISKSPQCSILPRIPFYAGI